MDTRYKHTLGKLINDAVKKLEIPQDLTVELEKALIQRNWVIYHFFHEYGGVGLNISLRKKAIDRLEKIWPFFEKVTEKINALVIKRMMAESG